MQEKFEAERVEALERAARSEQALNDLRLQVPCMSCASNMAVSCTHMIGSECTHNLCCLVAGGRRKGRC